MTITLRIVATTLFAATAIAAVSSDALARHRLHHAHFGNRHLPNHFVRYDPPQPAVDLPPMRYYGGPKSPMWRG